MKRIVIVGAGRMAQEYVKVLRMLDSVLIVGVISKTLESAEKFANDNYIQNFSDINFLRIFIDKLDLSHIILCVPPDKTYDILEELSGSSYSVLVEKPIGINLEESSQIVDLSTKNKLKIYPALNRRFLPAIFTAKQILRETSLVDNSHPKYIYVTDQQDTVGARNYGHPKAILDNWHFANGIHMMDLALSFCEGQILRLNSNKIEFNKEKYVLNAEIELSSGDKIFYSSFWNLNKKWELGINFGEMDLILSPIESLKVVEKNGRDILSTLKVDKLASHHEPEDLKPGLMNIVKWFLGLEDFNLNPEEILYKSHESMGVLNQIYRVK